MRMERRIALLLLLLLRPPTLSQLPAEAYNRAGQLALCAPGLVSATQSFNSIEVGERWHDARQLSPLSRPPAPEAAEFSDPHMKTI